MTRAKAQSTPSSEGRDELSGRHSSPTFAALASLREIFRVSVAALPRLVKRCVNARIFDLGQLLADLLVGRPFLVVHLDKFPSHDALLVDHQCCRMGPALAVGIKQTVAVDDLMFLVFEQREVEFSLKSFLHHLGKLLRVLMIVNAHRKDLHLVFLLLRQ